MTEAMPETHVRGPPLATLVILLRANAATKRRGRAARESSSAIRHCLDLHARWSPCEWLAGSMLESRIAPPAGRRGAKSGKASWVTNLRSLRATHTHQKYLPLSKTSGNALRTTGTPATLELTRLLQSRQRLPNEHKTWKNQRTTPGPIYSDNSQLQTHCFPLSTHQKIVTTGNMLTFKIAGLKQNECDLLRSKI